MPPSPSTTTPALLLTGFEPFGGDRVNPSWQIAERLDGWQVEPLTPGSVPAVVRAARLPCVFHQALTAVDEALARHRPIAVIGLGLAASRPDISVERVAINVDDARIPDNAGCQPIDEPVCAGAPAAYWSTLPIKAMVAAMQEAGIAASISQSAGTFVCNHVFFGLAHRLARQRPRHTTRTGTGPIAGTRPRTRGGFIHVPWPRGPEGSGEASNCRMDLPTLVEAIRIAIRVTLATGDRDARLPGGAID